MSTKKVVLPSEVRDAAITADCTTVFFYAGKSGTQDAYIKFPKWFTDLLLERMDEARKAGREEIREKMRGLLGVPY